MEIMKLWKCMVFAVMLVHLQDFKRLDLKKLSMSSLYSLSF